jgi:myo-inositol-1(or 4)-monophosphatase
MWTDRDGTVCHHRGVTRTVLNRSAASSLRERVALADAAEIAAREAGGLVAAAFRAARLGAPGAVHVEEKAEKDLVTEWDRRSEDLLRERLGAAFPDVPVVGEETYRPGDALPPLAFVVDPIDGTTNFTHGHPFWCVSVGVLEEGRPVAGALIAPPLHLSWKAAVDPDGAASMALRDGVPCRPSTRRVFRECLIATGFPPNRDEAPANNFDSFMSVKRRAQAVRRCGSAAIDIAFVGDGTYDAYWERRLHVWDCAAAAALVLAAGGTITALDGGPPDFEKGHIAVSNGLVHEDLLAAVHGR